MRSERNYPALAAVSSTPAPLARPSPPKLAVVVPDVGTEAWEKLVSAHYWSEPNARVAIPDFEHYLRWQKGRPLERLIEDGLAPASALVPGGLKPRNNVAN